MRETNVVEDPAWVEDLCSRVNFSDHYLAETVRAMIRDLAGIEVEDMNATLAEYVAHPFDPDIQPLILEACNRRLADLAKEGKN